MSKQIDLSFKSSFMLIWLPMILIFLFGLVYFQTIVEQVEVGSFIDYTSSKPISQMMFSAHDEGDDKYIQLQVGSAFESFENFIKRTKDLFIWDTRGEYFKFGSYDLLIQFQASRFYNMTLRNFQQCNCTGVLVDYTSTVNDNTPFVVKPQIVSIYKIDKITECDLHIKVNLKDPIFQTLICGGNFSYSMTQFDFERFIVIQPEIIDQFMQLATDNYLTFRAGTPFINTINERYSITLFITSVLTFYSYWQKITSSLLIRYCGDSDDEINELLMDDH
jgi:hypothetical protein